MSDGSQTGISIRKELIWGELDAGQLTGVNFTDEDMKFAIENKKSKTVRPDRQTVDLVQVGASTEGGLNSEFQADNLDKLLDGFFWDVWRNTNLTAGATGSNLDFQFIVETGSGVGGLIVFGSSVSLTAIKAGDSIFVADAVEAGNNGFHYVKGIDGQEVNVDSPLVNEVSQALTTVSGSNLYNGVTKHSYSMERANYDIDQFFLYLGMSGSKIDFSVEIGEPVMVAMSFIGKDETLTQASLGTGSPTELSQKPSINAASNVAEVIIDGVAVAECLLQSIEFSLDNKVEGKKAVGTLGFCGASGKSIDLTGKVVLYFKDNTYYDKYKNSDAFSIRLRFEDNATPKSTYIVSLYNVKFDSATANVTGKDDDVLFESSFVGTIGPEGKTIGIFKYPTLA